jgi:hypothetical protein
MLSQLSLSHLRQQRWLIPLLLVVVVLVAVAVLALALTGGGGNTTAQLSSDLVAVGEEVFPFQSQFGYYGVCGVDGNLSNCPYTDRLRQRLTQESATLCRCQNPSQSREVSAQVSGSGGVVAVTLWDGRVTYDLEIVSVGGRLLVDDETCHGQGADTSIYQTLAACSPGNGAAGGGAGTMPVTTALLDSLPAYQGATLVREWLSDGGRVQVREYAVDETPDKAADAVTRHYRDALLAAGWQEGDARAAISGFTKDGHQIIVGRVGSLLQEPPTGSTLLNTVEPPAGSSFFFTLEAQE